ncbi:MAG: hypothetical protein KatS3mg115_0498 [Candidatus Poribacteria bacterium]|nr:MAG: hypothetical protein KatS3mg115_0498 [Candidatus Poribacteria bacterium]
MSALCSLDGLCLAALLAFRSGFSPAVERRRALRRSPAPGFETSRFAWDGTEATVLWKTDQPTTGEVRYWPEDDPSQTQAAPSPDQGTEHRATLSGLLPETAYAYEIAATTLRGETTTSRGTFASGSPGDSTPRLLDSQAEPSETTLGLSLIFNETVTVLVQYGTDPERLVRTARSDDPDTRHTLLLSELSPDTEYFWRAIATDLDGNRLEGKVQQAKTEPAGGGGPGEREIRITARQWNYAPGTIRVPAGAPTTVRLRLTTADVAHGFGLPEFGLNANIKPRERNGRRV